MNASSLEVLQKVLTGFIIMELDMRWSEVKGGRRRKRCPKTKRVPGWSRFAFRCHKATNERKRERERERETCRKALNNLVSNDRNKKMVRMHEKCMNM